MRVALLDHDLQQRKTLEDLLQNFGHECLSFVRFETLKSHLQTEEPDILLLHWTEDSRGLSVISYAQSQWPTLPVLAISSRPMGDEAIHWLAERPADIVLKPLRRNELLLRIDLLLSRHRSGWQDRDTMIFGVYEFITNRSQLRMNGQVITLTQKEFELALLFFQNLGRPLSRAYIHETVWSRDAELSSRTLDTHVSRVRNKLELKPEHGYRLVPVYSFGYRLEQLSK